MKKKIFITGATGFIGKELIKKIYKKYKLYCLVRKNSDISAIKDYKINLIFGDLLEKDSIFNSIKNIDTVIHLATSHSKGKEDYNLVASKNLIEVCKKQRVKRLIFISSMAVNRKLLDGYGKTKLKIEEIIKNSGLNYIILRPSIIYSKNNLSLIGSTIKSIPGIIPIIGNGKYKLNPVYLKDVIDSIEASIETKQNNKTYDVAGKESFSFNEIIQICKKRFKIHKLTIHIPLFLVLIALNIFPMVSKESIRGVNEDTNADISSLKKDLNIIPVSFMEGIKNVNL